MNYKRKYLYRWWWDTLTAHCSKTERWGDIYQFVTAWCEPLKYRTAPAACHYHGAWPGGLIDHMARVMDIALDVAPVVFPDLPLDSVALCAGLHDTSKMGMMINGKPVPRYVPNEAYDSRRDVSRENSPYRYNPELDKTSMTVQNSGIVWAWLPLSLAEWKAISFHDGMYVPENVGAFKMHNAEPLLLLTHFADISALQYETGRAGNLNVDKMLGRPGV